jgi:asparagine synthase (glutamine-hydrolysing)
MGFAVPIAHWLRGPLSAWAGDCLAQLRKDPMFDAACIEALWREHLGGTLDHSSRLWPLLMFQSWLNGPHGAPKAPGLGLRAG